MGKKFQGPGLSRQNLSSGSMQAWTINLDVVTSMDRVWKTLFASALMVYVTRNLLLVLGSWHASVITEVAFLHGESRKLRANQIQGEEIKQAWAVSCTLIMQ